LNAIILRNIEWIAQSGRKGRLLLRMPGMPGFNDSLETPVRKLVSLGAAKLRAAEGHELLKSNLLMRGCTKLKSGG